MPSCCCADAAHAAELLDRRDTEAAREVLVHVDALYRGEAFEDEVAEWSDGLREDVRAAWGRSVRRLANLQLREGRGPEALGLFTRLLGIDPYDEQVHRRLVTGLVRAGRHGEARRAFEPLAAGDARTSMLRRRIHACSNRTSATSGPGTRSDATLMRR